MGLKKCSQVQIYPNFQCAFAFYVHVDLCWLCGESGTSSLRLLQKKQCFPQCPCFGKWMSHQTPENEKVIISLLLLFLRKPNTTHFILWQLKKIFKIFLVFPNDKKQANNRMIQKKTFAKRNQNQTICAYCHCRTHFFFGSSPKCCIGCHTFPKLLSKVIIILGIHLIFGVLSILYATLLRSMPTSKTFHT